MTAPVARDAAVPDPLPAPEAVRDVADPAPSPPDTS